MSPSLRSPDRHRSFPQLLFLLVAVAALAAPSSRPLSAQDKPPLTVDDYGPWKRIGSAGLSPDGTWMTYVYDRLEGDDTLFIRALDGDQIYTAPRGASPAFSGDSRWVAYLVGPPEREGAAGAAGRGQAPPQRGGGPGGGGGQSRTLVLRNLASGDSVSFADVASVSFPDSTDVLLIRKGGPGNDAGYDGADLVVYEPATGSSLNLGNVSEFAVNETGDLSGLPRGCSGRCWERRLPPEPVHQRHSAHQHRPGHLLTAQLERGGRRPGRASGDRAGGQGAAGQRSSGAPEPGPAGFGSDSRRIVHRGRARGVRPERALAGLNWSEDGQRVFLGIKEQADEREELENRANVDVWHWADVEVQSVQEVRAQRERNQTWSSVVNLGRNGLSFLRLADESLRDACRNRAPRSGASVRTRRPYEYEVAWGGSNADYYRVDLDTGARTPLAENVGRTMGSSPDGAWWLFLRNQEVIAETWTSGQEVNLTQTSGVDFIDRQDDHPYELPVYGVAGWSNDNKNVLLYDRFDVWEVPVDGSKATNLTAGNG